MVSFSSGKQRVLNQSPRLTQVLDCIVHNHVFDIDLNLLSPTTIQQIFKCCAESHPREVVSLHLLKLQVLCKQP